MPLDPSIYNQAGRVNFGAGFSDILDQQRQREMQRSQSANSLAELLLRQQAAKQQQELGGFQLRDFQRKEAAIPQQQAHARSQELNSWLSGAVQSGRPQEEVMAEAIAKGQEIGVAPEVTQRHVQSVFASAQQPQARSDYAFTQAYPEMVAKQRAEAMFAKEKAALTQGQRGQIIFDNQGNAFNVNPYTNEVHPVEIGGKQIQGAQFAPNLQGQISGAREVGKLQGKTQAQARIDLPQNQANAAETIKLIDDLLAHKGMKQAVGASSMLGLQRVPGTEAKNFAIRLEQLKGKQFLQAFESLKGGGQITEIEGQKATAAISRMDLAATEEEFTQAAREFQNIIKLGLERAKMKAGVVDDEWNDL